jgi:hypothetical protein
MSYAQRNFDWRVFVNEAANETVILEHTQGGKTRVVVPRKSMGWWDCDRTEVINLWCGCN